MKLTHTETEPASVFIQIKIPDGTIATLSGLPANNHLGMYLLYEVISLELRLNGVIPDAFRHSGNLNDSIFAFGASDINAALKSLRDSLERTELWQFATVYYWDERERFLRPFHFGAGVDPSIPLDPADLVARSNDHRALHDARRKFINKLIELLPTFPLPPIVPPPSEPPATPAP